MIQPFALSWVVADDDPPPQPAPSKVKVIRPRLTCPGHDWGDWMRDMLTIKTPDGVKYAPRDATRYRQFCRRCNAERKGQGTAWGTGIRLESEL